ncbi:ISAs1 family transposase [Streptomyces sp. NPDC002285]
MAPGAARPRTKVELTGLVDLPGLPEDTRIIVRRERPHPNAQLSLFDLDEGTRHQVFLTDTPHGEGSLQHLEVRHHGHGRRATRTVKAIDVPAWIDFTAAPQVAQLRRTVTRKGRRTVEIVYLITSADARTAPPELLATWVQSHWEIENRLHWVRDVTFDEDRSQVRTGNAPRVMAGLRNIAITLLRLHGHQNIAAALRHHARDTDRPINLLLTS